MIKRTQSQCFLALVIGQHACIKLVQGVAISERVYVRSGMIKTDRMTDFMDIGRYTV